MTNVFEPIEIKLDKATWTKAKRAEEQGYPDRVLALLNLPPAEAFPPSAPPEFETQPDGSKRLLRHGTGHPYVEASYGLLTPVGRWDTVHKVTHTDGSITIYNLLPVEPPAAIKRLEVFGDDPPAQPTPAADAAIDLYAFPVPPGEPFVDYWHHLAATRREHGYSVTGAVSEEYTGPYGTYNVLELYPDYEHLAPAQQATARMVAKVLATNPAAFSQSDKTRPPSQRERDEFRRAALRVFERNAEYFRSLQLPECPVCGILVSVGCKHTERS